MSDAINPDHYKRLPAEAIEIIEAAIDNAPSNQAALLHGQVLKYILRCWDKNGIEDLRKAKWYLDRLIQSFDESEQRKEANIKSLMDYPFGEPEPEQQKTPLNSDKIPEGYRKLNDSSEEPRQLGDLRWSVSEKRYVEIGVDEIGYANRDNWAACRKITEPPDGWRWLEVGEVIRKGDTTNTIEPILEQWVGTQCVVKHVAFRRNKFEVGEKVVRVLNGVVYKVIRILSMGYQLESEFCAEVILHGKDLAPYIEEQS